MYNSVMTKDNPGSFPEIIQKCNKVGTPNYVLHALEAFTSAYKNLERSFVNGINAIKNLECCFVNCTGSNNLFHSPPLLDYIMLPKRRRS